MTFDGMTAGRRQVPAPSSRYILPQFEERTSYGMKRTDPYTKLFEDRIIFLGPRSTTRCSTSARMCRPS